MEIVDKTSICNNQKGLLDYLSKLKDDVVIRIDDENTGIFLPEKKVVVIEYYHHYAGISYTYYDWDDYVNELKKDVEDE